MQEQGMLFEASEQRQLTPTEMGYIGGIYDGEGSIRIYVATKSLSKYSSKNYVNYKTTAMVSNTDVRLVDWLKSTIGMGYVSVDVRNTELAKRQKDAWRFHLRTRDIRRFLPQLIPYLLIKHEHAKSVLDILGAVKKHGLCHGLTEQEAAVRQDIYDRYRSLPKTVNENFVGNHDKDVRNAYVAGLFDGEGCFSIKTSRGRMTVDSGISNTHHPMLEWLRESFGIGKIYKTAHKSERHATSGFWRISPSEVPGVVKEILPYLLLKRRRAEIVVEHIETWRRLMSEWQDCRKRLCAELKLLNKRGPAKGVI